MNFEFKKIALFSLLAIFATTNILIYPFEAFALSASGGMGAFAAGASCYGIDTITGKMKSYGEKLLGETITSGISKAKNAVVDKAKKVFKDVFGNKAKDTAGEIFGPFLPPSVLGGGGAEYVPVSVQDKDAFKDFLSEFKDYKKQQLGYKKDEKTKERCLDSIVNQAAKFLIRKMVDDLANWLRNGAQGKPRFIQDFGAYLKEAGDVAGGLFLEQLLGDTSLLCEPWRLDITASLPRRKGFNFDTQCRISGIIDAYNQSGINVDINGNRLPDITIEDSFNDFSKTGWLGFFSATFNNPIFDYLKADAELMRRMEAEKEKRILEAQVNQGLLISTCVKEYAGLGGKKCLKTEITSPGVAIAGAVNKLFNGEIDELFLADEINELIAAAIDGIKARRLWSGEGVSGFSSSGGRGGWLSDDDPINTGDDIFNPPNITKDTLLSTLEDFIFEERDYLMLKKESKKVIETEIITLLNDEKQKEDLEKQLIAINRQITESESLVYEKGSDPIENLLKDKYPEWTANTEQKEAFCAEPEAVSNAIRLLPMTKAEVICAEDDSKIEELADLINNDLPFMLGTASDAASEYENLISLRNELRSGVSINPPLGSHENNNNATCSVKGWAFDTNTPNAIVLVRILRDGDESNVLAIGATYFERSDIADCAQNKLCGFEISLIGAVASSTVVSLTAQAQDTSNSSWHDLSDTPKDISCL